MIYETAHIADITDSHVLLETQRKSTCDSCSANKACGVAALQRFYSDKKSPRHRIELPLSALAELPDSRIGDLLQIGLDDEAIVSGSVLLYGYPIIAMLAAAMLGSMLFGEGGSALAGLLGFGVSLWWINKRSNAAVSLEKFQPVLSALP